MPSCSEGTLSTVAKSFFSGAIMGISAIDYLSSTFCLRICSFNKGKKLRD